MPNGFASGGRTAASLTFDTESAVKMLDALVKSANDSHAASGILSHFAHEWEEMVFRDQGAPEPGMTKWAALSAGYAATKPGSEMLVNTGALKQAVMGDPRETGFSVTLRAPGYALYLARGRHAANSAGGGRGGSMPHRNPAPRPKPHYVSQIAEALLAKMFEGANSVVDVR